MKNFIQRGDLVTVTAPMGDVISGQGVLVGNLFGVAATTVAEGESVEMIIVRYARALQKSRSVILFCSITGDSRWRSVCWVR